MPRLLGPFSLSLLVVSIALGQETSTQSFRTPPGGLSMPMVAPLFLDDKDFSSAVTLVNDAIAQMSARVVVIDSSGVQVASKEVIMAGHTSLPVQIRDLLTESGSAANSGSVLVIPQPAPGMPIGAQLSITSKTGATPAYIEEEMLQQNEGRQGIYHAATLAVKGSPIVALKSLGQSAQSVTLQCLAEKTGPTKGTVQLLPGQLLLVAACDPALTGLTAVNDQLFNDQRDRGAVGVAVSTTGAPGDLITFGFSIYNDERGPYFSSLNFTNPTEQLSSGTIFTGIPAGAADQFPRTIFRPEVAVSNFSIKPAEISITLAHTLAGNSSTEVVQKFILAGQSSRTVQIPAHGDAAMTNSLIVRSSLPPGEVVSQFIAWGDVFVRTVELQPKDNDSVQNGGGHPWTIAAGTDSTLFLFNHSADGPKAFEVLVGNGKQLWVGSYKLAPMETKAVRINEIVEKQIPDAQGTILSKDIRTGQVGWWTHRAKWGKGRLMVSQSHLGMARSFSCGTCANLCGAATVYPDASATFPIAFTGNLGGASFEQCLATCGQCGGTPQGPASEFPTWSSINTSIATVYSGVHSATATFKGVNSGFTTGRVTATDTGCTARGSGVINVCPSSVSLGSSTPESLQAVLTNYKTGLGIYAKMQVSPSAPNGLIITETLSSGSNTCPPSWGNLCRTSTGNTSSSLSVGTAGTAFDGTPLDATPNVMWDEHIVASQTSLLSPGQSCSAHCNQQYSCGGTIIGQFTITYTFGTSTINGTPVTTVTATKQ